MKYKAYIANYRGNYIVKIYRYDTTPNFLPGVRILACVVINCNNTKLIPKNKYCASLIYIDSKGLYTDCLEEKQLDFIRDLVCTG